MIYELDGVVQEYSSTTSRYILNYEHVIYELDGVELNSIA